MAEMGVFLMIRQISRREQSLVINNAKRPHLEILP